jgi:hypothetical protein
MSVVPDTVMRMDRGREQRREPGTGGHPMTEMRKKEPWAQVLSLGDARFGILVAGPFDGRCYPLPEGRVPRELDVPGPGGPEQPATVRYVLRDGLYRYAGVAHQAVPAA